MQTDAPNSTPGKDDIQDQLLNHCARMEQEDRELDAMRAHLNGIRSALDELAKTADEIDGRIEVLRVRSGELANRIIRAESL